MATVHNVQLCAPDTWDLPLFVSSEVWVVVVRGGGATRKLWLVGCASCVWTILEGTREALWPAALPRSPLAKRSSVGARLLVQEDVGASHNGSCKSGRRWARLAVVREGLNPQRLMLAVR